MNENDDGDADPMEAALQAIRDASSVSNAADRLRVLLREHQSRPALAILYGFSFVLVLEQEGQLLPRPEFEPRYRSATGDFPPPIDDWEDGLEALLIEAVSHPSASVLVQAQLGLTIWRLRPSGTTRPIAERALASAIRYGADPENDVWERYRMLAGALDLTSRLRDDEQRTTALAALLEAADLVIAPSEMPGRGGGTAHDLLRLYIANGGAPAEAVPRIEAAIREFGDQSRARTELALLLESTAKDDASRRMIVGEELDRLIAEADSHNGLMRDQLLREAQQLARSRGLTSHIRAVGVRLAQMTVDDFDLKEHDVHVQIPGGMYRAVMAPFAEDRSPEESLKGLLGLFPPFTPAPESRERSVIELIASPVQISTQGLVTHAPSSEEELQEYWQRHDEYTLSQFYVGFLDAALQELVKREDFVKLVLALIESSELLTEKGKNRLRRALTAYIGGEWDVVLDTLPTVEAAIRELGRQHGALTINPAGSPTAMANRQKLLGGLLESLSTTVPTCQRLFRYWEFMLVDQLGWNIRNNYLHGLTEEGTRATAGVVLHIFIQLLIPLR